MKQKKKSFIITMSLLVSSLLLIKAVFEKQPDPTLFFSGDVKWLGNPLAERWPAGEAIYARNIWDLQYYKGKIYIGSGNSANSGPAPNAGPIDIWSYHPKTGLFKKEGIVNDEQIDRFNVINGEIFIPGHDAASPDNWDFGNYYTKSGEQWVKHRTIPKGIHVYDMLAFDGKLFAALGSHGFYGGLATSVDHGETWETTLVGFYRLYQLFEFNKRLYATGIFRTEKNIQHIQKRRHEHASQVADALFEYQDQGMQALNITLDDMFPDWLYYAAKLRQPNYFKKHLVYIGAKPSNDHQYTYQQLYKMKDLGKGKRVILPAALSPQDMIIDQDRLLLLTNQEQESGLVYENTVLESHDLKTWSAVLSFKANTFARSFEYVDGCFYFGMGGDAIKTEKWWTSWTTSPLTGAMLRSIDCSNPTVSSLNLTTGN